MSPLLTPEQFSRVAAAAFAMLVVLVVVALMTRSGEPVQVAPLVSPAGDSLAIELERCRGITPEQTAAVENCRRVWTENRQRFIAPAAPAKRDNRIAPNDIEHQQSEAR